MAVDPRTGIYDYSNPNGNLAMDLNWNNTPMFGLGTTASGKQLGFDTSTTKPNPGYTSPITMDIKKPVDLKAKIPFFDNFKKDGKLDFKAIGNLLDGVGSIAEIFSSFQQNKLAKDQFEFQKQSYNTNLTNQLASYNTALGDRSATRAAQNNRSQESADAYYNKNKLSA